MCLSFQTDKRKVLIIKFYFLISKTKTTNMQFFKVIITFTLLTLTTHKCLVNSNTAPGDTKTGGNRFNTHLSAVDSGGQPPTIHQNHQRYQHIPPHQQQQPHHQHHHGQHQYAGHIGGGGAGSGVHHPSHGAVISGSSHIYHPAPNSGHAEPKNTYNLLSEAMSQAVSNEFSKLIVILNFKLKIENVYY